MGDICLRYNHRSVCLSGACGCVCVHAWRLSVASTVRAHVCPFCAAGAAARARGAGQGHRLHEGEGAPGVARPVQGLGVPVRPARGPAALRVRGGAGAALLPRTLLRRALGRRHAALDAAAAALPVAPAAEPARAWLEPAADRRALGVGRTRPARWRAGTRPTPSSWRCRRRPTGPT